MKYKEHGRFYCDPEEENGFMRPPKEGSRSIQACFMRLMHRYTSVNYKRFLGIGIHPGQLAFVKAISEHEGISQRELAEGLHVKAPTVAVAVKRLEKADVIIYAGSLVNPDLLDYAKKDCQIHNSARLTLDEVIDIMKKASEEDKTIVRLHTGEPSIYGAVREQMDELDKLGIEYESCPGVSACFGAAASLNLEYTLPDISQSLIITRMEGRTKVPPRESIESFAAHQASMAIYLSTGMLDELSRRLVAGGYREDTPAALVYKATWPEEEKYICTVKTLAETAREHKITKTALVLVGDVIGHRNYEKSRLYAPDFSTEYRQAKEK